MPLNRIVDSLRTEADWRIGATVTIGAARTDVLTCVNNAAVRLRHHGGAQRR
jgi:hypothetical protein